MNRARNLCLVAVIVMAAVTATLILRWERSAETMRSEFARLSQRRGNADLEVRDLRGTIAGLVQEGNRIARLPAPPSPPTEGMRLAEQAHRHAVTIRAWAARKYGAFFRMAGLSPDQIEKFEDALTAHWLRVTDIQAAARTAGVAPGDPLYPALWKEEYVQFVGEEKNLLGPTAYQQLKEYSRTDAVRPVASAVAGLVFASGEPLTSQQSDAITQILAANSPEYQQGKAAALGDLNLPAVMAQAGNVLTPTQLSALQTALEAQAAGMKFPQVIAAAQKTAK